MLFHQTGAIETTAAIQKLRTYRSDAEDGGNPDVKSNKQAMHVVMQGSQGALGIHNGSPTSTLPPTFLLGTTPAKALNALGTNKGIANDPGLTTAAMAASTSKEKATMSRRGIWNATHVKQKGHA